MKSQKEEKAFDETLSKLDYKVQHATSAYEKTRPRAPRSMSEAQSATASHDRYIQSLSSLSSSISAHKVAYAESSAVKRQRAVKEAARVLCSIAEASWRNRVEGTKKGGALAGLVVEKGVFCESSMSLGQEDDDKSEATIQPRTPAAREEDKKERSVATGLRGPRPQPGSEQDSACEQSISQPSLDSSLFKATSDSSNTYNPRIDALQPPNQSSSSSTYSRRSDAPHSARPSSAARLASTDSFTSSRHPVQQVQARSESPLEIPVSQQMVTSHSASTMHSLSSATSSADSRNIIPPRGFIMDEEPMSPTSPSTAKRSYQQDPQHQRTEQELRRPTPRYGGSPLQEQLPQLERTDTSASERNFVARMREKYAQEKERKQEEEERSRAQDRVSRASG